MVHAFTIVKTRASESEQLLGPIHDFETVTEVRIVTDAYNTITRVDTDAVYEMLKTTSSRVQGLEGIADTKTYISLGD